MLSFRVRVKLSYRIVSYHCTICAGIVREDMLQVSYFIGLSNVYLPSCAQLYVLITLILSACLSVCLSVWNTLWPVFDVSLCLSVFSAIDNENYNSNSNYRSDTFVAFVIDVIVFYHVLHFVLVSPPGTVVPDGLMLMYIMFVIICLIWTILPDAHLNKQI